MDLYSNSENQSLQGQIEKAINFLYIGTVIASVCINIFDIFRLISLSESFILYTNIPAILIIFVSFLLKITNLISLKQSFVIIVLTILANSIISVFQSKLLEDLIISLLRESIFMAFLISLASFVVSRKLAYFITGIFSLFVIFLYFDTKDSYILENLPILISIFIAYTIFINYLIRILRDSLNELNQKNMLIKDQLEEIKVQNEEFVQINEELLTHKELLEEKNDMLNKKNIELTVSQQDLKKSNETKNKLFTVIGHDIKNPMHVILGYSGLLFDRFDTLDNNKKKQYADIINGNIKNLFRLLENLLTWSKTQQNDFECVPELIDPNHIITSLLELYKDVTKSKQIKVEFSTEPNMTIFADKNMVETVFRNIFDNAVKYSNSGENIFINMEKYGDNTILRIADNGIGLPDDIKENIFNPNEKQSRPGTLGEKGTGFGLAISKEFIEKNNGKIWMTSSDIFSTIFHIQFPSGKPVNQQSEK